MNTLIVVDRKFGIGSPHSELYITKDQQTEEVLQLITSIKQHEDTTYYNRDNCLILESYLPFYEFYNLFNDSIELLSIA